MCTVTAFELLHICQSITAEEMLVNDHSNGLSLQRVNSLAQLSLQQILKAVELCNNCYVPRYFHFQAAANAGDPAYCYR